MRNHYNNILVPTDFSEQSLLALEQSYPLARSINVEITLLHVIQEQNSPFILSLFTKDASDQEKDEYEETCFSRLVQICESATKNSGIKINPLLLKGKVSEKITEVARDVYARFIVMAANSSDPEHKKAFIGSTASNIISDAPCPVLTFNGKNIRENFNTIILPLDLTKETSQKLNKAIEIARYYSSTVRIVSVFLTGEQEILDRLTLQLKEAKEYIEKRDIYCTAQIVNGNKATGTLISFILEYAYEQDGDLIMIMTQQEKNLREKFIGSTAQEVISQSRIPVLSVVPKR
jgi:nucleotide-binding universal stress UspA family protein